MAAPPSQSARRRYVPEKNLLVTTHTSKPRIIICDSNIKNLVSVRRIGLDKPGVGIGGGGI